MFSILKRMARAAPVPAGLAALLLTGCFAGGAQKAEPAAYDLFASASASNNAGAANANAGAGLWLRLAEIQAPAWLNTPAMQYRLAYAEPERRYSFAESRWVAPPAELLEQVLRRQEVVRRSRYEAEGCQLHLALDEFVQTFDAPGSSRALIEIRATLLAPRGVRLVAQRTFSQAPAAGGDAKSGVAGFVVAARGLGAELNGWLNGLQRDTPELMARCRAAAP